jgi:hypothetical protein
MEQNTTIIGIVIAIITMLITIKLLNGLSKKIL